MEYEFAKAVLATMAKHDAQEDLSWHMKGDEPHFEIWCNDIFWWSMADAEEITPENLPILDKAYEDSFEFGGLLFVARVRNLRPQGAFYQVAELSEEDARHFDEAGPERPIEIGNPVARDGEWCYPEPTGTYYPSNMKEESDESASAAEQGDADT